MPVWNFAGRGAHTVSYAVSSPAETTWPNSKAVSSGGTMDAAA
jgi:hypothetical protein